MPTENRSSITEMVSVPREWLNSVALLQMPLEELQDQAVGYLCEPCDEPAEQRQGEPVALPGRKVHHLDPSFLPDGDKGWNAYHDEIAKLGPLYTHANPGEIERCEARLHEVASLCASVEQERDTLRAQLAEQDALLHEIRGQSGSSWLRGETQHKLDAALSASAEPSAPTSQTINGHWLFCKAVDDYKPGECSCGAEPETKS